ncbi:TRAP transporter large permease [Eubacterium ramulus]
MTSTAIFGLACFGIMIALIILGIPIAISMFVISVVGFYITGGISMLSTQLSNGIFSLSASYTFAVVPLFMIVGVLAGETGIASSAYNGARAWVGKYRGGLLYTTVVSNALFGACSGISVASNAVFCKIAAPELRKAKYDDSLSLGCISAAGSLSSLIPPSIPIITVCILSNLSIGTALICGTAAGIITMLIMMFIIKGTQLIRPDKVPEPTEEDRNITFQDKLKSLKLLVPILALFALIVGGSFFGWFSATVGGAVASVAIIIYAIIRRMPVKQLLHAVCESASQFAGIYLMIMAGSLFSRFITTTGLANQLASLISGLHMAPIFIFLIVVVFYLFCGCFIAVMPIIIITVPVLLPLLENLGFNPYAMAICLVLLCELGNITPPVGNSVFTTAIITGENPMKIFKGVTPFFIAELASCVLFGMVPIIVTFLPNLLGM